MLPVATPPNAVAFSSRRVPVEAMARAGLVLNLVGVVVVTVVFELWARRVLGIEDGLPPWAR
jgi:sodium-dependent dicarboxylate transporter 2/3/5